MDVKAGDSGNDASRGGRRRRWKEIADGASPFLVTMLPVVFIAIVLIYAVAG